MLELMSHRFRKQHFLLSKRYFLIHWTYRKAVLHIPLQTVLSLYMFQRMRTRFYATLTEILRWFWFVNRVAKPTLYIVGILCLWPSHSLKRNNMLNAIKNRHCDKTKRIDNTLCWKTKWHLFTWRFVYFNVTFKTKNIN